VAKRILILFTIFVSLISLLTYTAVDAANVDTSLITSNTKTWLGLDCNTLDEELIPLCNDINALNERTIELENLKLVDLIKTAPLVKHTDG